MNFKTLSLNAFREFAIDNVDSIPITSAYHQVGWFGRGIDIRSDAVNRMPYDLMRGDMVIANQDDDISRLSFIDIFHLFDDMVKDLDLFGAFYAVYETNEYGRNGAWRRLLPTTITSIYSRQDGQLLGFKRTVAGRQVEYECHELLYIWMPSIVSENAPGTGIGHRALMSATILNNIEKFQAKFFENGALNPTIVGIPDFGMMKDSEQSRVKSAFTSLMTGLRNAFKIIPLGANVTVTNLQQPLRDMGMTDLTTKQREEISTALGVPQSLLFSNASNYAVATQDTLNFYDLTIVPFCLIIQDQLNARLFIPNGVKLLFKWERLEVYQSLELQKAQSLSTLVGEPIMTRDEARERLGLSVAPALEDSNEWQAPVTAQPITTLSIDIANWKRYAVKRYREGRPEKALFFKGMSISEEMNAEIVGLLSTCNSIEDVQNVFETGVKKNDSSAMKSISASKSEFEADFDKTLAKARNDKMKRLEFVTEMRALINRYGLKAYKDGMSDGGVEDDPSPNDKGIIDKLATAQQSYITSFSKTLYNSDDGISDAMATQKASIWYAKSILPFYKMGTLSANANGMYIWKYGATEQHCTDCARLEGQKHRMKDWVSSPYMPQSDSLECKGFQCDCRLVKTNGRASGNY